MYAAFVKAFDQKASPEQAAKMAAYMRDQFPFFGIGATDRKAIYKAFISAERKKKAIDWVFLDACWSDPRREFHYLVVDYLVALKRLVTYDDLPRLTPYLKTRQWWDTIDGLDAVIGDLALRDPRMRPVILAWAQDEDFWLRRVAINHQLGLGDMTDPALLGDIIVMNLGSREFFINKAIGWSLRDYARTDPDWVKAFVDRHRDRLDKLSVREAMKHLG